jgi:hypothetical protein
VRRRPVRPHNLQANGIEIKTITAFPMKTTLLAHSLAVLTLAGSLSASQFSASYLFPDDSAIYATFSGSLDGNRITGISDVVAEVTGTWWEHNTGSHALKALNDGAEMTLDGSFMHFSFYTGIEVPDGDDPWDQNVLWCAFTQYAHTAVYYYQAGDNFAWDASRWSVNVVEEEAVFARMSFAVASEVPDSGSSAALLFAGLLALSMARRTFTA